MLIKMRSGITGIEHEREIDITSQQLDRWRFGTQPIQNVFPQLSTNDREFLMTGITPEEWKDIFNNPEGDIDPGDHGTEVK